MEYIEGLKNDNNTPPSCRRLIGRFYLYTAVFIPSILGAAIAIMVERKSRRPLLAGYVATVVSILTPYKVQTLTILIHM